MYKKTQFALGLALLGLTIVSIEAYAESWCYTETMEFPRYKHTATLLNSGEVLVAGGGPGSGYLAACELYDPSAGSWSRTGDLRQYRSRAQAVLLESGEVLLVGGIPVPSTPTLCELYDPSTGTWDFTGCLNDGRIWHSVTRLKSGKVLVAGGSLNPMSGSYRSCELYDPSTGSWSPTGFLNQARYNHTATLLVSGEVLVTGGQEWAGGYLNSCELYDPSTGTWSYTATLGANRSHHAATLLGTGEILVSAGFNYNQELSSCMLYDPVSGSWSPTGSLNRARHDHTATVLASGEVLVAAGAVPLGYPPYEIAIPECELYDPSSGIWSTTGALHTARYDHTMTALAHGPVLVTGGIHDTESPPFSSCELYTPLMDVAEDFAGAHFSAVRLEQNYPNPFRRVTTVGYQLPTSSHVTLEIYDVTGKLVRILINGTKQAGHHTITWDGRNDAGEMSPSRVYFQRLTAGPHTSQRKMLMLR